MFRHRPPVWLALIALAACDGGCGAETTAAGLPVPTATAPLMAKRVEGLPTIPPDPREVILAKSIGAILASKHLLQRPFDDALSKEAFDEYLELLDGGKLFLLEAQVEALGKLSDQMDEQLASGDLVLARHGEAVLMERQKRVSAMVAEILEKPFDFSKTESVESDPEKVSFASDEAALRERWRKVLKLQVLQRVAAMEATEKARRENEPNGEGGAEAARRAKEEIPPTADAKEKKAREDVATSYEARFKRLAERDPLDPAERFLGAVTTVYDPHTAYLAPSEKANFDIELTGSLEGIGALLGVKDHLVEVRELVPGGASWRQGKLEAGDLILAVAPNGEKAIEVADLPLDRVVDMIRGPKGTVVTLRVQKPDRTIAEIAITRDVIVIEAAYARGAVLDLGQAEEAVGYIHLPGFYGNPRGNGGAGERNASDDVRKLLELFESRKLPGVIVDLRGNGGGLLSHARDITGHLIERGPVVQVRAADGEKDVLHDEDPKLSFSGEVVIMVDRFSASASEILAGALQDYQRAVIVGTGPTHGKGTVQMIVELERMRPEPGPPLGILKLTTQQYFLVDGDSVQSRGVEPDITLPDPAGYLETGERHLDHAIPWLKIEPVPYSQWKPSWSVSRLKQASRERVEAEPLFDAVAKRNQLLEKRREDTEVPLEQKAFRNWQDRSSEELEALREQLEKGPARFEVESVSYAADQPGDAADPRIEQQIDRWRKDLARDAWLAEALRVLAEMAADS